VTLVYQHELPNVAGKSIKGVLVEYGPGGYSPGHTHAKSAFIYATVLEGAIRSQVNDGPVTTYEAGQSFSELPGDRHGVSANASETKPAKLLAVFVVDTNQTELTIPLGNLARQVAFPLHRHKDRSAIAPRRLLLSESENALALPPRPPHRHV
jgi:quercetin dioxygenase-like cupin family protein